MISAPRSFTPSRAVIELSPHACWSPRLRSYASLGRMCQTLVDLHTRHWSLTPAMSRFVCRRSSGPLFAHTYCGRVPWSHVSLLLPVLLLLCCVVVIAVSLLCMLLLLLSLSLSFCRCCCSLLLLLLGRCCVVKKNWENRRPPLSGSPQTQVKSS